jgi:predicted RNA methylase
MEMVSSIIFYLSLLILVDRIVANDSLNSYSSKCDIVLCKIVNNIYKDIEQFKIMNNDNICIPQYGSKSDELCNSALEEFSLQAPIPDDSKENEFIYDKKIDDLEKLIDAPLHVIYLKQLSLLRDKALKTFKQTLATAEGTEFDAMMQVSSSL